MFNPDFFPTPKEVIYKMLQGVQVQGKRCFEPEAGKGDIMDVLHDMHAAEVMFCETNPELCLIAKTKGRFLANDFLTVTSSDISHVDLIVMNPPFSADEKHILHAFDIAPAGCQIVALCNSETLNNPYTHKRKELNTIVKTYGEAEALGDCFSTAERKTNVNVSLINIRKPGGSYESEFEGFFTEEDDECDGIGIMSYNFVRDLVNRYVEAVKIFDKQLEFASEMNRLTAGYYSVEIGMSITDKDKPIKRDEFKKAMQKSGWSFVFKKLDLKKYATKGLKEKINKFVEEQTNIPFTMRNIYKMLQIIAQTNSQRMDEAALEVFDRLTQHYHENRYNVEGWKTNSHYILNRRFIFPNIVKVGYSGQMDVTYGSHNLELLEDLIKVLAHMNGDNFNNMLSFYDFVYYPYKLQDEAGNWIRDQYFKEHTVYVKSQQLDSIVKSQESYPGSVIVHDSCDWGQWQDWGYFRFRAYKKGTCHLEFKNEEVWAKFNQKIAELKGFPLYEKAYRKPEKKKKEPIIIKKYKL